MLCDLCQQNMATVHLTQIVDGKTSKADLCEACSKEKGVDDPTGFPLFGLVVETGKGPRASQ
jgi:protein arginine kinase activator